ncbi:ABC transporter permease [Eleftheria terrae]|uniref:ABC transporter permease n=1 Tax=Eleftheria terrae TaxID=1597781 RepID=UPI00263B0748|nr:iron ABC transporter permease [Eleftheria terrae]WKB52621.1 iron ABC transporter permease [Eleftheria terrae]
MLLGWRRDPAWTALTGLALGVMLLFLVWPLLGMLGQSLVASDGSTGWGAYLRFFSEAQYRTVLLNTLVLGAAVTLGAVLLGGGLAFAVARCSFPLAGWVAALPLLTLVIPDVVVAAAWVLVLGKQGLVNEWLARWGWQLPSLYTWWGLVFVMTLDHYVYAFVAVLVGLKSMDRGLEEAALSLGSPPGRVMRTVTVRLLMPSVFAAVLVVFTHVIGSFGIPAILGPRIPVLAVKAYNEFVSEMGGDPQMPAATASVLVLLGSVLLLLQKLVVERRQYQMESGRPPLPVPLSGWRAALATGGVLALVLLSALPTVVVLLTAFTPSAGPILHYGEFTLRHFESALMRAPEPLYNSLFLAAVATAAGVLFSVVTAYLVVKRRSVFTAGLDLLVMLPLTVAGTVLGIALAQAFSSGWLVLAGTWPIMALAYFLRRVPSSVRAAAGPLHNVKDHLEDASMSLGVGPLRTFFQVVVPVIGPSVAAAAVLMWITSLSELSATVVLYFGGMSTMPIEIFQQVDSGRLALASAYSVLLLVAIFIPLVLARWVFRLRLTSLQ